MHTVTTTPISDTKSVVNIYGDDNRIWVSRCKLRHNIAEAYAVRLQNQLDASETPEDLSIFKLIQNGHS